MRKVGRLGAVGDSGTIHKLPLTLLSVLTMRSAHSRLYRNIIEHTYTKAVESRKSVLTEEDQQLLKQFLSAKEKESQANRVEVRHVPPEMRGVVQALFICFAVVITLLVSGLRNISCIFRNVPVYSATSPATSLYFPQYPLYIPQHPRIFCNIPCIFHNISVYSATSPVYSTTSPYIPQHPPYIPQHPLYTL